MRQFYVWSTQPVSHVTDVDTDRGVKTSVEADLATIQLSS